MSLQASSFQKPENVLQSVNKLIDIDHDDQALRLLFDFFSQRNLRNWQPAHEALMKKFIDLCVEKQNHSMVKEGLHQYRNLSIHQYASSFEGIIDYLLKKTEKKAKFSEAIPTKPISLNNIHDLDNNKTPEKMLLESINSHHVNNLTEEKYLITWVRFLWESYRVILESIRGNAKLVKLYFDIVSRAFEFCVEYNRTVELRKLCDMIRSHISKSIEDLSPESLDLHLKCLFDQLKKCSKLGQWKEGFRTIDEICTLFRKNEKYLTAQMWATFYNELTSIFLMSNNHLFHAYTKKAFYLISAENNKSLSKKELQIMASCALLSSLTIPTESSRAGTTYTSRESQLNKNRKISRLLGFYINPKPEQILNELLDNDILKEITDDVRQLYYCMKCSFEPLSLVQTVVNLFNKMKNEPEFVPYIKPLEEFLIIRVIIQLSKIYYSVTLDTLKDLFQPLAKPFIDIENIIIQAVKNRQIDLFSVRIDHMKGCLYFDENIMEDSRTNQIITEFSRGLSIICSQVTSKTKMKMEKVFRQEKLQNVLMSLNHTHEQILLRKEIIDKHKEKCIKDLLLQKEEKVRVAEERQREQLNAEAERVKQLQDVLDQKKLDAIKEEEEQLEINRKLIEQGLDMTTVKMKNLSIDEQKSLIEEAQKKNVQDSLDLQNKVQDINKRLDSYVRATREVEIPKLKAFYENQSVQEKIEFTKIRANQIEIAHKEHEENVKQKASLGPIYSAFKDFKEKLLNDWTEKARSSQREKIELLLKEAKIQRARKRRKSCQQELEIRKKEEERVRKLQMEKELKLKEMNNEINQEKDKNQSNHFVKSIPEIIPEQVKSVNFEENSKVPKVEHKKQTSLERLASGAFTPHPTFGGSSNSRCSSNNTGRSFGNDSTFKSRPLQKTSFQTSNYRNKFKSQK